MLEMFSNLLPFLMLLFIFHVYYRVYEAHGQAKELEEEKKSWEDL